MYLPVHIIRNYLSHYFKLVVMHFDFLQLSIGCGTSFFFHCYNQSIFNWKLSTAIVLRVIQSAYNRGGTFDWFWNKKCMFTRIRYHIEFLSSCLLDNRELLIFNFCYLITYLKFSSYVCKEQTKQRNTASLSLRNPTDVIPNVLKIREALCTCRIANIVICKTIQITQNHCATIISKHQNESSPTLYPRLALYLNRVDQ